MGGLGSVLGPAEVVGQPNTMRMATDRLDAGWSTRTPPHLLPPENLAVADNVTFYQDGLVLKRPGNVYYGGGSGATGSGAASLAGTRFYFGTPQAGQLVVQSGGKLFKGVDATGAFTQISAAMSAAQPATFAQMYDPDMSTGAAIALVVCDGSRIPQLYDGTNFVPVQTGSPFLPNGATGSPITPKYVFNWNYSLIYGGEPTDPTALYISDALRPERFTGNSFIDSAGFPYTAYYPAGRDGRFGVITGFAAVGPALLVFFTSGIVLVQNTGSSGAFQYVFSILSSDVGCPSPRSIVEMGQRVAFFGGDRFYWTDGTQVVPILDEIPTVYSREALSYSKPLIGDVTAVAGVRRGLQYWASYPTTAGLPNSQIVVFDFGANGGQGAWSRFLGMSLNWGLECRGPGDTYQCFWGSSAGDVVAQYDAGTFSDFGNPISIEVRAKSFNFGKPANLKTVQAIYLVLLVVNNGQYTLLLAPYAILDQSQSQCPTVQISVSPGGITYGSKYYGQFTYQGTVPYVELVAKAYAVQIGAGLGPAATCGPGFTESSTHPLGIVGFVIEVTVDEPAP